MNALTILNNLIHRKFRTQLLKAPTRVKQNKYCSIILSLRVFDPVRSRKAICDLYERVTIGDLTATEIHTKIEVLSWTAKLCR